MSTNPQLTPEQRSSLFAPLLDSTVKAMEKLADGDERLLWALRRKLAKELTYLERGTPAHRMNLKAKKWNEQEGLCAICGDELPEKGAELDRTEAFLGYTVENTRLVHHRCHVRDQEAKGFS